VISSLPYICALTGYTTEEFKQKAKDNGMNYFLTKPFESKEIDNLMAKFY
jgi:CheY-like chemotaxis protein